MKHKVNILSFYVYQTHWNILKISHIRGTKN